MSDLRVEVYVEKLNNLVHSDSNPRYIKKKRNEDLKKSLSDFPEMKQIREIIIDENNLILAGDKRAYALEEMGYKDALVKKVIGLSEKQKREFIIKDNDHNGDWDGDIIARDWDKQEIADWGIPDFKMPGEDSDKQKDDKAEKSHDVNCPNCGFTFDPRENDN